MRQQTRRRLSRSNPIRRQPKSRNIRKSPISQPRHPKNSRTVRPGILQGGPSHQSRRNRRGGHPRRRYGILPLGMVHTRFFGRPEVSRNRSVGLRCGHSPDGGTMLHDDQVVGSQCRCRGELFGMSCAISRGERE
ncbi:hypothetical protein ACHAWX_003952 [Stephanocyclus meneghinianus]